MPPGIGKKLKFDRVKLHTVSEGEIDDIKLAVAGLLGALFLSNLQQKTLRGMQAAVLAGRFSGAAPAAITTSIALERPTTHSGDSWRSTKGRRAWSGGSSRSSPAASPGTAIPPA